MSNEIAAKAPVVIPFVCPICAGENAVNLIALSRAGGVDCGVCEKWLRSTDVMRAIHSPRTAREADPAAQRARAAAPSKREVPVWPPTAESRAAVPALFKRSVK